MQKWEYLFAILEFVGGAWGPTNVNGQESGDWEKGTEYYDFANQMGEQGWELVAFPILQTANAVTLRLVFKRPKNTS